MILFGAEARAALLRGAELMTALIEPTLGPKPRTVLMGPIVGARLPEILDHAATIARRVHTLADGAENAGAMLIRDVVCRVSEKAGDGGATAALMACALLREATRMVAGGVDPRLVARGVACASSAAVRSLCEMARPIGGREPLTRMLVVGLGDAELAAMVAEAVEAVGEDGLVSVEDALEPRTGCEYVDGMRWDKGWLGPAMAPKAGGAHRLLEPRILVTDLAIERVEQLLPVLEACGRLGGPNLLIVASAIAGAASALLHVNRGGVVVAEVVAVGLPSAGAIGREIGLDIAAATGGRMICGDAGQRLEEVSADDLGSARLGWVRRRQFGIIGGRGSRAAIRARLRQARAALKLADADAWLARRCRERIGNLNGVGCVIAVGGHTESARTELRLRVEAAVASARAALQDGVVPGGGSALVAASNAFGDGAAAGIDVGARALATALTAPMRSILVRSGIEPGPVVDQARTRGSSQAFDALRREWRPLDAGIVDTLAAASAAIDMASSALVSAIGAEVVVGRKGG